jgi:hypothetical protein
LQPRDCYFRAPGVSGAPRALMIEGTLKVVWGNRDRPTDTPRYWLTFTANAAQLRGGAQRKVIIGRESLLEYLLDRSSHLAARTAMVVGNSRSGTLVTGTHAVHRRTVQALPSRLLTPSRSRRNLVPRGLTRIRVSRTERHPYPASSFTCSPGRRSVLFAAGPGAFSYQETFEKFHERDVARERTSPEPQGPYVR